MTSSLLRSGAAAATALALVALAPVATSAAEALEAASGPRLAVVRSGLPLPGEELLNTDPSGAHWFTVKRTPNSSGTFENPAWSSDGTELAFGGLAVVRVPGIYVIRADGGAWRVVPGTRGGSHPAFSPDGKALAFARLRYRERKGRRPYLSVSTWVVDLRSGRSRRLTPWRNGLIVVPGSFSPDGTTIVAMRNRLGRGEEIVSLPVSGGPLTPLIRNGYDPTYSPDGTAIAFVRLKVLRRPKRPPSIPVVGGDLFVASADGSSVRRLTFNPSRREESPSWDPSGERLAYAQYPAKRTFVARSGIGSAILEINKDGTCRRRLLFTYGLSYEEPAWQPGPGREAGRIEC